MFKVVGITLCIFSQINVNGQTYNTSIAKSNKVEIKGSKVSVDIRKQYNYYGDSTKGISNKPELDLLVDGEPNPSIECSKDSLRIKIKVKSIDKPIAKNIVDYTVMINKRGGQFICTDVLDNDIFNSEDQFNEGKANNIKLYCSNEHIKYQYGDSLYIYFRLSYTDRYGKRPDTLRRIFIFSNQPGKCYIKSAKPYMFNSVRQALKTYKLW